MYELRRICSSSHQSRSFRRFRELMAIVVLFVLVSPASTKAGGAPEEVSPTYTQDVSSKASNQETAQIDFSLLIDFERLNAQEERVVIGFWIVIGTFCIVLFLLPILRKGESTIAIYRPYEERLLKINRLDLEDVLNYHSQFKWSDYSGIAIGMVLLSITLIIINSKNIGSVNMTIQSVIVCLMAIAVVLLVFADLTHTNTQTPIIPVDRRFQLIDLSVQFGTIGTLLLVLDVLLFTSMVGIPVVLISCFIFLAIVGFSNYVRRIPKTDFFRYFGVVDETKWLTAGHKLKKGDPRNELFQHDTRFIRKWQSESKEAFYQKLGQNRPLSVFIEDWIQKMMSIGVIESDAADRLRESVPQQREVATRDSSEEDEFIKRTLSKQLNRYLSGNLVTEREIQQLVSNFANQFDWSEEEMNRVIKQATRNDQSTRNNI